MNVPKDSLDFWQQRFETQGIAVERKPTVLKVQDPDQVSLTFYETDQAAPTKELIVNNEIPADKQILGLADINFYVPDPQKTADFFKQLLGWSTEKQTIQLSSNEKITLTATAANEKTRMGRGSIDHVAFAVKDDEALDLLYKKARQQKWQIEKIISRGYFKSLYIREPGGNRVEFATESPGFTIDEPLEHLGEQLALPPFLADQRASIEEKLYSEK